MKYILLILLIIVIFAISITVGAANDQTVTFNYLLAQADVRLSTLLAILFGSGFIVGWLLTGIFFLKLKLKHTATKRRLKKVQKQYDDKLANHQKTQLTTTH